VLSPRRHACDLKCKAAHAAAHAPALTHAQAARIQSAYRGVITQQILVVPSLLEPNPNRDQGHAARRLRSGCYSCSTSAPSAALEASRSSCSASPRVSAHAALLTNKGSVSCGAVRPSYAESPRSRASPLQAPRAQLWAVRGQRVQGSRTHCFDSDSVSCCDCLQQALVASPSALVGYAGSTRRYRMRGGRCACALCSPTSRSQLAHEVLANHRLRRTGCP
jgi:hypothetical protein